MSAPAVPLLSQIRDTTQRLLHHRPCLWQCKTAEAILKGDKHVINIAATGSGKTLTFWMPLLFRPQGIQIIITPLNLLGKQNVKILDAQGIKSVAITAANATPEIFRVSAYS